MKTALRLVIALPLLVPGLMLLVLGLGLLFASALVAGGTNNVSNLLARWT